MPLIPQKNMTYSSSPRKKIGLALSGGVARGPAHVGVLTVLEREGIPIDYVAGASAGAIVGAAYCAGIPMTDIRQLALKTGWRKTAMFTLSRHGLLSFARIETIIDETTMPGLHIEDLATPFTAVVTDLEKGEQKFLQKGPLGPAVRASCSVPGLITPVKINGRLYCDGGVSDNLPVDAVRAMGADYVIGVDLFVPIYRKWLGFFGAANAALQTLVRQAGGGYKSADCLIVPDISGHNFLDFSESKTEQYIRAGEEATEAALPLIKAALADQTIPLETAIIPSPN